MLGSSIIRIFRTEDKNFKRSANQRCLLLSLLVKEFILSSEAKNGNPCMLCQCLHLHMIKDLPLDSRLASSVVPYINFLLNDGFVVWRFLFKTTALGNSLSVLIYGKTFRFGLGRHAPFSSTLGCWGRLEMHVLFHPSLAWHFLKLKYPHWN